MVVIDTSGEAMVEELELNARVEVAIGLPGDVLLSFGREGKGCGAVDSRDLIEVGVAEIADIIVALLTVTGF